MSAACQSQESHTDSSRSRKGHKKSRGGCYNCKRRKVKVCHDPNPLFAKRERHVSQTYLLQCQENQPTCHNCTRINATCKYPPTHVFKSMQSPASALLNSRNLQSTPVVFNASDMRLFHHFIIHAYPHLPLGNDAVWQGDIAAIAHSVSQHMAIGILESCSNRCSTITCCNPCLPLRPHT